MKTSISLPFFSTFFFLTCSFAPLIAQGDGEVIIYVSSEQGDNNDFTEMHTYGKDWSTAFRYLHDALSYGDPDATQIWIAKGNYYVDRGVGVEDQTTKSPAPNGNFLNPFVVSNRNLKIYGGFAGNETELSARDPEVNKTYLDGNVYYKDQHSFSDTEDLDDVDNRFAKRILVVYNSTLTLDGLIFQYLRGGDSAASGGLEDTEPDIGKGAFILANQSALTINNCLFQYGLVGHHGLMVYTTNNSAPVRISNSRFTHSGNTNNFIYSGGGDNVKVIVENSVIENLKKYVGGGSKTRFFYSNIHDIELRNSLFYKNDYLEIIDVNYLANDKTVNRSLENVLVFDNSLSSGDFIKAVISLTLGTVNLSITNSSFINNTTSGAIISTNDQQGSNNNLNLTMHNNVFYGNKTSEDSNTYTEILKAGSDKQFKSTSSISHNATDNSDSKLITNSDYNDGVVNLSGVSSLTDLFVGTNNDDDDFNAKGADDQWFTEDDGFVPKESGALHNAGHNDAVTDINADIKGHARLQDNTVDIGAYEYGTEETPLVEGLSAISELVLYPNPIRSSEEGNHLLGYVTDSSSRPTRLVLRDLGGKLVRDLAIKDSGKGIDLGVLPTGTYLAILTTENKGYKSFKVVVE